MKAFKFILIGSAALILSMCAHITLAQQIGSISQLVTKYNLRLVVTVFGINKDNSDMFIFATVNNTIKGKMINGIQLDKLDNITDGITELGFSYPEPLLKAGQAYSACAVILTQPKLICGTNHKSPNERTEFIDLFVGKNSSEPN